MQAFPRWTLGTRPPKMLYLLFRYSSVGRCRENRLAEEKIMERFEKFLQYLVVRLGEATGISVGIYDLLFSSLVAIALLWSLRWLVLKLVWWQTEHALVRYQWRRISSYAAFVLTA